MHFSQLNILLLEDDIFEVEKVVNSLKNNNFGVNFSIHTAINLDAFYKLLDKQSPELILLDIKIGEEKFAGLESIREIRLKHPGLVIVMRSFLDDAKTIEKCLKDGADDFISKHSDNAELSMRILQSYKLALLKKGVSLNSDNLKEENFVGQTMEMISQRMKRIVDSAITSIYIQGESGTGKEVAAKTLQMHLPEGCKFISVNCGAISDSILESELFGHEKGAFTGANAVKHGYLESASGGWLFLDEVARLSMSAQVALLRVLETGDLLRVGSTKPISINVKIISATNEDIEQLIKDGKFRLDLWQRLNEVTIKLPPLRERKNEIPSLLEYFSKTMMGGPYEITKAASQILIAYDWEEGNIRELRNCLRAMTEYQVNKKLTPLAIPEKIYKEDESKGIEPLTGDDDFALSSEQVSFVFESTQPFNYDELCDKLFLQLIDLVTNNGEKVYSERKVSNILGMARSTYSRKIKSLLDKNLIKEDSKVIQ